MIIHKLTKKGKQILKEVEQNYLLNNKPMQDELYIGLQIMEMAKNEKDFESHFAILREFNKNFKYEIVKKVLDSLVENSIIYPKVIYRGGFKTCY